MKKKLFIGLSILAGLIALWIIFEAIPVREVMKTFTNASVKNIASYIVVSVLLMISLTWRWHIILKSQDIKIPFHNLFAYRIVGYGVSYLTPSAKLGGEPVRAGLLTRHKLEFHKALSSVAIDKTLETSASMFFFVIGVITVLFSFAVPKETGFILLVVAGVFITFGIIFYQRMTSGKGVVKSLIKLLRFDKIKSIKMSEKKIEVFEELLIKFFKRDKTYFMFAILISFLSWILMFFEFKFAALILGMNVSILATFIIITFVGLAFIVPVPMAMGSLEASQIAAFAIVGIKTSTGVAMAFLVRSRDLLWSLIGMLILSYYGIKVGTTLKKGYNKNENNIS